MRLCMIKVYFTWKPCTLGSYFVVILSQSLCSCSPMQQFLPAALLSVTSTLEISNRTGERQNSHTQPNCTVLFTHFTTDRHKTLQNSVYAEATLNQLLFFLPASPLLHWIFVRKESPDTWHVLALGKQSPGGRMHACVHACACLPACVCVCECDCVRVAIYFALFWGQRSTIARPPPQVLF